MRDNFYQIVNYIRDMNIWWLLLALSFIFIYWLLKSLGLRIFASKIDSKITLKESYQLTLRSQFVNAITPFASGGQPYQIYYLAKSGMSGSEATSIVVQNSIVFQIALVCLGIIAIISNRIFDIFARNQFLAYFVALGFIVNFVVIVILFIVSFNTKANKKIVQFGINLLSKLKLIKDKEKKKKEWEKHIAKFHNSAKLLISKKKDFFLAILCNFLALLVLYSIPLIVLFATGDYSSFNIFLAIITSAYVLLIGAFVPTPGGTGGLEFGFLAFYGNFVDGARLTAILLVWRFVTYYFGIIIGGIAMYMKKVKA
jgi:uncharacterized protein (TIRG00374 family)